jgi:hypothetical protein
MSNLTFKQRFNKKHNQPLNNNLNNYSMSKIFSLVLEILKVILAPLKGIKYCKSSCCECECIKNNNIDDNNNSLRNQKE